MKESLNRPSDRSDLSKPNESNERVPYDHIDLKKAERMLSLPKFNGDELDLSSYKSIDTDALRLFVDNIRRWNSINLDGLRDVTADQVDALCSYNVPKGMGLSLMKVSFTWDEHSDLLLKLADRYHIKNKNVIYPDGEYMFQDPFTHKYYALEDTDLLTRDEDIGRDNVREVEIWPETMNGQEIYLSERDYLLKVFDGLNYDFNGIGRSDRESAKKFIDDVIARTNNLHVSALVINWEEIFPKGSDIDYTGGDRDIETENKNLEILEKVDSWIYENLLGRAAF